MRCSNAVLEILIEWLVLSRWLDTILQEPFYAFTCLLSSKFEFVRTTRGKSRALRWLQDSLLRAPALGP